MWQLQPAGAEKASHPPKPPQNPTWVHGFDIPRQHPVDHGIHNQHHHGKEEVEVIPFHGGLAEGVPLDAHARHFVEGKVL